MLQKYWLRDSVQVGQLEGHATDATITDGRVRREDKEGNDAADIAAEFGRLRQPEMVIDARRNLQRVDKEWYPRMLVFRRFMVAISRGRLSLDDDGGSMVHVTLVEGGFFRG